MPPMPATTSKVSEKTSKGSEKTSKSDHGCGHKRKPAAHPSDAASTAGSKSVDEDEEAGPPTKKGKVSLKTHEPAASHSAPRPRPRPRPIGKSTQVKTTDDVAHHAVPKSPNVANDEIEVDEDPETLPPVKKQKAKGLRRTGMFPQL